jgi:hypothetical protein
MILPQEETVVFEKNKIQEKILKEARGDLKEYSRIIHRDAEELRKKYKGKFKVAVEN